MCIERTCHKPPIPPWMSRWIRLRKNPILRLIISGFLKLLTKAIHENLIIILYRRYMIRTVLFLLSVRLSKRGHRSIFRRTLHDDAHWLLLISCYCRHRRLNSEPPGKSSRVWPNRFILVMALKRSWSASSFWTSYSRNSQIHAFHNTFLASQFKRHEKGDRCILNHDTITVRKDETNQFHRAT